jgi:hypothetical protein
MYLSAGLKIHFQPPVRECGVLRHDGIGAVPAFAAGGWPGAPAISGRRLPPDGDYPVHEGNMSDAHGNCQGPVSAAENVCVFAGGRIQRRPNNYCGAGHVP